MKQQDAPGQLELVRAFVNTRDLEGGTDEFADQNGLRCWLAAHGLLDKDSRVRPGERQLAVRVREALREFGAGQLGAAAVLDEVARSAGVTVGFGLDGMPILTATRTGVPGAVGQILALTATAVLDGSWQRMKVCPAPDCRWMFYDHSRNRSGTWCQMAECGNRAKIRAYRSRAGGHPTRPLGRARPATETAAETAVGPDARRQTV